MTFGEIQAKVFLLTNTSENQLSDANLSTLVSNAYDRVVGLILKADDRWNWDDINNGSVPKTTINITSGTADYALDATYLTVDRVEIEDSGGTTHQLHQVDQQALDGISLPTYQTSGLPNEYDLQGAYITLYPNPNYTRSNALIIYHSRSPLKFDYSDDKFTDNTGSGSSVPGFAEPFHDLLALIPSYEYAVSRNRASAKGLQDMILRKEQELQEFYGERNRDKRPRISVSTNRTIGSISGRINRIGNDSNR